MFGYHRRAKRHVVTRERALLHLNSPAGVGLCDQSSAFGMCCLVKASLANSWLLSSFDEDFLRQYSQIRYQTP